MSAKFLLPRVVTKRKISAPSLLLRCISAAPFLLLRSTSPFACAFKPWAWLIHWGLDATQNISVLLFAQGPCLSLPPNLVLRRRSPGDPRITGPAGRVITPEPGSMYVPHISPCLQERLNEFTQNDMPRIHMVSDDSF